MHSGKGYVPTGDSKTSWSAAAADYSGAGEALTILGNPVMERWETPYMAKLAEIAAGNGGWVLEIGFGLGISASFVQQYAPVEHVIIEANAQVYQHLLAFREAAANPVTAHLGMWEDVVPTLADGGFDGILYDTYPLSEQELHTHQFRFIAQAHRLLKPDGVLTYCNLTSWGNLRDRYPDDAELFRETQLPRLRCCGFSDCTIESVVVAPPANCRYYRHKTIPAPLIRK
jgi:guanidinoacetate N-methyltransferase